MVKRKFNLDEEIEKKSNVSVEAEEGDEAPPPLSSALTEEKTEQPALPVEIPPHYALKDFVCPVNKVLMRFKQYDIIRDQLVLRVLKMGSTPIALLEGPLNKCPKCSHVFAGHPDVKSD